MQASEPAQRNQPLKASTRLRRSESLGLLMALTVVIQLPATRVLVLIVKDNLDQPEFIALQEKVPDKPHIIIIPNRLTHIINQEAPVEATVNRLASHSSWTRPWNSVAQLAAESMPYWMNFPHQLPRTMTTRSRLQQTSSYNHNSRIRYTRRHTSVEIQMLTVMANSVRISSEKSQGTSTINWLWKRKITTNELL